MNCPGCGAAMRLEEDKTYLTCDYCTTPFFPEPNGDGVRDLGAPADSLCPVCGVPLAHAAIGDHRVFSCERCRGILLPMPLLVDLIGELRPHAGSGAARLPSPRDLERKIRCPKCHQPMDTHPYAGGGNVVIDSCSRCFLDWLDYGELQRILHAPDHESNGSLL